MANIFFYNIDKAKNKVHYLALARDENQKILFTIAKKLKTHFVYPELLYTKILEIEKIATLPNVLNNEFEINLNTFDKLSLTEKDINPDLLDFVNLNQIISVETTMLFENLTEDQNNNISKQIDDFSFQVVEEFIVMAKDYFNISFSQETARRFLKQFPYLAYELISGLISDTEVREVFLNYYQIMFEF